MHKSDLPFIVIKWKGLIVFIKYPNKYMFGLYDLFFVKKEKFLRKKTVKVFCLKN